MPKLTILIRYLALLRHTQDGLTVLFPSDGHDLFIDHPAIGSQHVTENGDLVLQRNGVRYAAPVTAASADLVARLEDVASGSVGIRPEILSGSPHADLNGRLLLGGGQIRALDPYAAPHLKGKRWKIKDDYRPQLTDTLEFTFDVPNGEWQLAVPGIGTIDLSQGGQIIVENRDRPLEKEKKEGGKPLELEEFRVVYNLTSEPNHPEWPIPVLEDPPAAPRHNVDRAFLRGPSRPLCSPTQSGG